MITADQLLAHAVGDYLMQTPWMAARKSRELVVALVHAITYSVPFLLLHPSWQALAFVVVTHALIDRYRLPRWMIWASNGYGARTPTGYPRGTPDYLAGWLYTIIDNICHILLNGVALKYL